MGQEFDTCLRWKNYCELAIKWNDYCGKSLTTWRPKPPKRSLRKWLWDLLLA